MRIIADFMLMAGALGAAIYCFVLSQRLRRLTDLEGGIGGAIAALAVQADELSRKIDEAKSAAQASRAELEKTTARADAAARRLELLMASLDDPSPQGRTTLSDSALRPARPRPQASTPHERKSLREHAE